MTGAAGPPNPFAHRRHVVLLGAGHANLLVLRAARRLTRHGVRVTVVDPDSFWYSGMAAAVAGGTVHPGRDRIDPRPLAAGRGAVVRTARAVGLDTASATVLLDDGTALPASAVVLNVGSDVDTRGLPADLDRVTPVKPTHGLLSLRDRLATGPQRPRVVVVGAGASAVEVAANLAAGPVADAVAPRVTVLADGPLVPRVDEDVRERLVAVLDGRGVALRTGRAIDVVDRHGVLAVATGTGLALEAEHVVLATGLRAAAAVESLGVGDADGMPTTATLQHPDHPWLLGAGDCIRFAGDGLPRLGVFAVRQAPVLVDNLLALHGVGRLRSFEPQSSVLVALDLADGEAVVLWRGRSLWGRPGLVVKRLFDEWFLRRHRVPIGASGRGWGDALR